MLSIYQYTIDGRKTLIRSIAKDTTALRTGFILEALDRARERVQVEFFGADGPSVKAYERWFDGWRPAPLTTAKEVL